MLKRFVAVGAVIAALTAPALADSKSADECLKGTIDLAKEADGKGLSEDKLAKIEDLLTKMEGHCEAQQFAEASAITKDVKAVIGGN